MWDEVIFFMRLVFKYLLLFQISNDWKKIDLEFIGFVGWF